MTFWALFEHFHFKKIEMSPFSGSTTSFTILGEDEPLNVLFWYCQWPLSEPYGPKIGQNARNMTFWALFEHFHFKKIEMDPFSGSTYFWRLLGEYEPLKVLCWYCKGPLSGSYSPKIGQNCMKYHFGHFWNIFTSKPQK